MVPRRVFPERVFGADHRRRRQPRDFETKRLRAIRVAGGRLGHRPQAAADRLAIGVSRVERGAVGTATGASARSLTSGRLIGFVELRAGWRSEAMVRAVQCSLPAKLARGLERNVSELRTPRVTDS